MEIESDLRHGRHCVFRIHVHLVFVTKYRRNVFTKEVLDDLKIFFEKVCIDFESELVEFDGEDDHVHLLVNYPPKVAVSALVNSLKGVSSRMIRKKNYPSIKKKLWGLSLDQILIPCAIRSLAARKPSSLLCRASQPSQRAPQLAIPVRLLSIKPPSLAIAM